MNKLASRKLEFLDSVKLFLRSGHRTFSLFLGLSFFLLYVLPSGAKFWVLIPAFLTAVYSVKTTKNFAHYKYIFEHGAIAYGDYLDVFIKKESRDDNPDIYGVKYSFEVDGKKYFGEETANVAFGTEFPQVGHYSVIYYLPHNPRHHLAPELMGIRNINANMDGPQNH